LKRLAAISFIAIVLFNLYGYQIVIDFFQDKQETQLQRSLDKDEYNEQDLVYIKLPVNLPYYSNSSQYEKITGAVSVNGVEYRYVKRRIYNDSIELACVLNTDKIQFQSARDEFMKLGNDWLNTHPTKKSATNIKLVTLDFCNKVNSYSITSLAIMPVRSYFDLTDLPPLHYLGILEQPPDGSLA
jgi:hypothetical protein